MLKINSAGIAGRRGVGYWFGKLLSPVTMGVCVTLLALLFNSRAYDWRLSVINQMGQGFWSARNAGAAGARPGSRGVWQTLAGAVHRLDNWIIDVMYGVQDSARDLPAAKRVALVAIDGESMMRVGLWPWSRAEVARLLKKVSNAGVVGLDLIFNEPDPTSLGNYVPKLEYLYGAPLNLSLLDPAELNNDLELARHISSATTVIGAMFYDGKTFFNQPSAPVVKYKIEIVPPLGRYVPLEKVMIRRSRQMITNIRMLRQDPSQPAGEGFMNLFPDPSGSMFSVPLFVYLEGDQADPAEGLAGRMLSPALPLEMARVALGGNGYRLFLGDDAVDLFQLSGDLRDKELFPIKGVSIVDNMSFGQETLLDIPLNELGEVESGLRSGIRDFDVYPAWEVLQGLHDGAFDGRLVIIGGTIRGVGHMLEPGMEEDTYAAVEHASMLAAMLRGDMTTSSIRESYFWQQAAILASGLVATLAVAFLGVGMGMAVSSLSFLTIAVANYHLFFRRGYEMGLAIPLVFLIVLVLTWTVAYYLLMGRERRLIRKAFSLSVSSSILGYLELHPERLSTLDGENRNMTVLFTDIRSFTAISERMSAADLAQFLNEYFTPMSDIVMENMGTVDKFIGDGLMAFWNAPADNPYHARDAAATALRMIERLESLQEGWSRRGLPNVSIGCGINTGPMFAGYMGSEHRKNYTVMGDNVNIASRLESLNKVYSSSILITESTRDMLGGDFICRVVDKVRVSGKESHVIIYELLRRGEVTDEDKEELAAFSRVFDLYQKREFSTADALLQDLLFVRPAPLYSLYRDRLAIYKALPPPPGWDGTFSIRHK